MIDITKRRRFVRYVGLALLLGGCLLFVSAWAKRHGNVSDLTEDVLQLAVWCLFYLPLLVFTHPSVASRAIRRAVLFSFAMVVIWRLVDIADEIPYLHSVPLVGAESAFHSGVQHVLMVATVGSLLVVVLLFIDELVANASRLRQSNSRFQNLFDNMPTVCFTFDRTGRILSWNRAAERVYGYTAAEAIGAEALSIIVTPETLDATKRMIAQVFEGHSVLGAEWHDRDKNGAVGCRLRNAFPLLRDDGSVECGVNLSVDITDRRKAETALARSQQERKLIVDNVPALLAHVGSDRRYRYVNRRYAQWFGKTPDDTIGMHLQELLGDAEYQRILPHIEAVLAGVPRDFDNEVSRHDGRSRWTQVSMVPDLDDRGTTIGFYVMVKDVTQQRMAERDAESERALLRKLLDLQERERQTVTHDIHDGIVQYVVGAQMEVEGCEITLDPHDHATAQRLSLASSHLRDAVREGRRLISDLRPPIIDESGLVAAIDHLICEMSGNDGLRVEFEHHGVGRDLPPFLKSTLFRIVQEALNNVRRHSGANEAFVQLVCAQEVIRLDVRDEGRGFDRSEVSPSRFGLRGIEQRARLFGGKVRIESSPGKGTRIHVEMPFTPDERLPGPTDPHAAGSEKATA